MMMSKNLLILLVVVAVIFSGVGGFWFYLRSKEEKTASPLLPPTISQEEAKGELIYQDAAGFSFKYPKGIKVTDITPEDDLSYSVLSLTKGNSSLAITVKDTSFKTAEEWLQGETGYQGATLAGASSLAGIPAKAYTAGSKLLTLAIDKGVLYLIEGPKDRGFWEDTQNVVVSTFALAEATGADGSSAAGDDTLYEEEVVE